jgi:hypothetical protein
MNRTSEKFPYARLSGKEPEVQMFCQWRGKYGGRRDANELFYIALDGRLMAVQVTVTSCGNEPTRPFVVYDARVLWKAALRRVPGEMQITSKFTVLGS